MYINMRQSRTIEELGRNRGPTFHKGWSYKVDDARGQRFIAEGIAVAEDKPSTKLAPDPWDVCYKGKKDVAPMPDMPPEVEVPDDEEGDGAADDPDADNDSNGTGSEKGDDPNPEGDANKDPETQTDPPAPTSGGRKRGQKTK